ncbi:MAG: substrate-binding domain-containing protein [Zoogloeaceae bacterium]|nr:substrate-binding domain-containing protein [Zoogloeaceae bacterium]
MNAFAEAPPGGPVALRWVGDLDTANAVIRPLVTPLLSSENIALQIEPRTSTKGIRTVLLGQADIGGSGRYRIEGLPEETEVKLHPVAWDALVVVVHPDNPLGNIGVGDLKRLLLGEVTNWRQLGGGDGPIRLLAHEDSFAGIEYVLMNQLFGSTDVEFAGAELVADEFDIGGAVAADPQAVAVMSMASAQPLPLKPLSLAGVPPSVDTLKSGEYRLFRPLYLVRAPSHQHDEALDRIVSFVESARARPLIRAAGAVPYRQAVVLVVRGMDIQRELAAE